MKGLFDPDGVFARAMDFLWRMIVLNVLFVLCSIPLVTFGASSAALYSCIQKATDMMKTLAQRSS